MKVFGFEIAREQKSAQFEDVLRRMLAAKYGAAADVTPDNCERSPTVKAIVTAVSNRLAVTPVHVYRKATKNGRETKELLPDHPVAKLLNYPNDYQTRVSFWADAASTLVRWGNFVAYKGRGQTGPIRFLQPMKTGGISVQQNEDSGRVLYRYGSNEYTAKQLLHVRGAARDFVWGDSPVKDVADSIALEIAAEQFGLSFFDNGALPLLVLKHAQGSAGFKTKEQEEQFIKDFQEAFGGKNRHRAFLPPKGIEIGSPIPVENDKAQMIESRRYQRTVIAGAFGVPPTYVGDLERATFNNVEQQTIGFTSDVIYPVVQKFEAAMERDLLTDEDWSAGVVIRFNLDSILRADFKSRQEGLQIQRNNGVLSANEWREIEGKNPLADGKGGDDYLMPANMLVAGQERPEPEEPPPPQEPKSINVSVPVSVHTKVDGAVVDVKGGDTSVETPAPSVSLHNSVESGAPSVHVEPPSVTVKQADVTVYAPPPEITIKNDMPAPTVNVEAPTVNVAAPAVSVEAPNVKIDNHVASPTVNVEAPQVKIDNYVESPTVNVEAPNVTLEATVPEAKVTVQPITIRAPDVHIKNELPDYEQIEAEAVRDEKGRIVKTVTTKRIRK
jgi:phage portal protein, HK97 family